jgi:peptidoglycan/LPS O-acetylase OafA/YrhL
MIGKGFVEGTIMAQAAVQEIAGTASAPENAQSFGMPDGRMTALDGFRGVLTLMVVIAHFFGEVNHGIRSLAVGWFAVMGFFVLSGFLIGRVILERMDCANFVSVFYVRRFCRIVLPYAVVLTIILGLQSWYEPAVWLDADFKFPWWSYATFTQNIFMAYHDALGAYWLKPTWTLAVEEHFYLVAPAALMLTPRRHLLKGLIAVGLASFVLRIWAIGFAMAPDHSVRLLLPGVADPFVCGIIAAVLLKTNGIRWEKYDLSLRILPLVSLVLGGLCAYFDDKSGRLFGTVGPALMAIGAASFIMAIVRDAPEAQRFKSPVLRFFGHASYSVYLTHLAVLGLMHGLILGARPDIATLPQMLVTVAALPVAIAVGWIFYKTVEVPSMNLGRRWSWSRERRGSGLASDTGMVASPA